MAIFSDVASACMSTMMASAAMPIGQAASSFSTALNGQSIGSMWMRPSTFMTSTVLPLWVSNRLAPAPGASIRRG